MRVIGVIDLAGGRAVQARGGERAAYRPVTAAAGTAIDGDPMALARTYLELGAHELYVADLDAIGGSPRQDALLAGIAAVGAPLWIDAGVSSASAARECRALGAARVIVGLETLRCWDDLATIVGAIGAEATVFSLDLRDGTPLGRLPGPVAAIAARAAREGPLTLVVLDLARVGSGRGLDHDLLAQVREAAPGVTLVAGGGVRDEGDLEWMAAAGCDAALVATALQTGTLRLGHDSVNR